MKSYEIKTYTRLWVFKKQINPKNIVSDISFSEEQNGGQSNMALSVVWDIADFSPSDIVEIREVDDTNKEISNTYSGIINNMEIVEFQKSYILNIEIYWVFTRLSDIFYTSGWNKKFTKNATTWVIVKEIIDSFNAIYWTLSWTKILDTNLIRYTVDSIDTSGTTLLLDFDYESCLDSINKVTENSGFIWFVGADGIFYLKKEIDLQIKRITFEKEIIAVTRKLKTDEMTNKIYMQVHNDVELSYQDLTSQSIYWVHEWRITDSDIKDSITAQSKATEKMLKYWYEIEETTITLQPQKSSDFTPLIRITTQNTRTPITAKSIVKIDKRKDWMTLAIWDFPSLARTIKKIV